MRPSRRTTITASILLISCLTGSVLLLQRLDRERNAATLQEVLYISSPTLLKRMSLGYDGLLADIYWTRAVQYYGDKRHGEEENARSGRLEHYAMLDPLLDIAPSQPTLP